MNSISLDPEDQKIFNLLYTGDQTNDLLALEIIRNRSNQAIFLAPLAAIIIASENKDTAKLVLDFIAPQLTTEQRDFLGDFLRLNRSRNLPVYNMPHKFSRSIILEIIYACHRRTGFGIREFLSFDHGEHPARPEIFKTFMAKNIMPNAYYTDFYIPGLFPDEQEEYLTKCFASYHGTQIYRMSFESLKSPQVPDILFSKDIKNIIMRFYFSESFFPDFIFKIKGLEDLSFPVDAATTIPKDWSNLSTLKNLELRGKGRHFDNFDFVDTIPKLSKLKLSNHRITHPDVLLRKRSLPISHSLRFISTEGYTDTAVSLFTANPKKVLTLASALGKSILSFKEQQQYIRLITQVKELKKLALLPLDDLVALMNVSHTSLRSALEVQLDQLSKKGQTIQTLDANALLYITGTPSRKRIEIKQQLKALNIPLAITPDEAITHVVVCKNPKDYKSLQGRNLQVVSEQALYALFKKEATGFLEVAEESGDTSLSDNVLQLLYSSEISNVMIGLEMLKTGGVPEGLIEPLLVVYKTCPDTKTRGLAKKILLSNAPAELLPLINDSQRFTNLHEKVKAQDINKKLEKIARTTSRKLAAKLSLLLHERFQKGLRYILYHFHEPCPERSLALKAMMTDTHFDFSKGLGFSNYKDKDPANISTLYKMKISAKFPGDLAQEVPLVESADFHNCKLTSLPKNLGDLKDLKRLDLSFNFLGSIPKSIEAMTQLELLDLKMNGFKTFPSTLKRLTNLKVLDLRYNHINYQPSPLEVPEDIREALGDCEILV